MQYRTIATAEQLDDFCRELAQAETIAFDTEFVSEDTYWPHLCLVQVAVGKELTVIDTMELQDLTPYWSVLASGGHQTLVHAGREELLFSLKATGCRPANLFDLQIAAGLVGYEYPAGYGALVQKVVGQRPPKGETRTDWRRRPLSRHQIEYALSDVLYLAPVRDKLQRRLEELDRMGWLADEMRAWQDEVEGSRARQRWRKVSGISGLSARSLAIVRELWHWREEEAQQRDRPVRRVLRDDLIIEMAKRASDDPKRILAIRGLEHRHVKQAIPEFAERIARALNLPEEELPRTIRREMPSQLNILGQFLSSALTSICHSAHVAPSLVGTASDVRELVAWRLGYGSEEAEELPLLATGWRAEVVGNLMNDLLAGKKSIRIENPLSDEPLIFEPEG